MLPLQDRESVVPAFPERGVDKQVDQDKVFGEGSGERPFSKKVLPGFLAVAGREPGKQLAAIQELMRIGRMPLAHEVESRAMSLQLCCSAFLLARRGPTDLSGLQVPEHLELL